MATITITYPDAMQTRVVDALCLDGGWSASLGVTKAAFAKSQVAALVRQRVYEVEVVEARRAAAVPAPIDIT